MNTSDFTLFSKLLDPFLGAKYYQQNGFFFFIHIFIHIGTVSDQMQTR
ncbi:hypothetical protein PCIT_a1427 [Pseudoalteromonas citrea]|uniref:Uncharacterized protein n=1 Tax=Pseudoalteromonas citrea TaxID=43655 RepID=A0AAD4FTV9_9GAMM|nr:hypothetical protein PCIT_a1427 [Pseudoalteromonas citrea]